MNCEDVRDLLPAYVLGALDADELETVEAHLRAGNEHDAELVELRSTVLALDRFGREASLNTDFAAAQGIESARAGVRTSLIEPGWWRAAIAAVVLFATFGAGWLAADLLQADSETVSVVLRGPDGAQMTLQGASSEHTVTVTMGGLDTLEGEQVYQVWAFRDDTWLKIGVCNTNEEGRWKGDFDFAIRKDDEVVLTVEPPGGSETPSTRALLDSRF